MTYSTEPRSVVAAELPGWMRVGFSTKRFDSGSTIHHAHELSSDDELRQKWQLSRKEVAKIMKFPRGDDAQRKKG